MTFMFSSVISLFHEICNFCLINSFLNLVLNSPLAVYMDYSGSRGEKAMLILHEVQVCHTSANPLLKTGSQEYSITPLFFSQEREKERKRDQHDRIQKYTASLFCLLLHLTCEVYGESERVFVAPHLYFSLELVYLFIFLFIFSF